MEAAMVEALEVTAAEAMAAVGLSPVEKVLGTAALHLSVQRH